MVYVRMEKEIMFLNGIKHLTFVMVIHYSFSEITAELLNNN
jgi:hypothetical protein